MQVFDNSPYKFLTTPISGLRILLRESGGGLKYVGSVKEPKFTLKTDNAQIIDSASGEEVVAREIPILAGIEVECVAQEFLKDNLERFFQAARSTHVAANAAAAHAPELFTARLAGEEYILDGGLQTDAQQAALTVYNVMTAALLVLDTDYEVDRIYNQTVIRLLVDTYDGDTIRVGTGATAVADYNYKILEHDLILPLSKLTREISGKIIMPSKTGTNMALEFNKADFLPGANFGVQSKAPSTMDFKIVFKDDSAANPTFPFGVLKNYGYLSEGGAVL